MIGVRTAESLTQDSENLIRQTVLPGSKYLIKGTAPQSKSVFTRAFEYLTHTSQGASKNPVAQPKSTLSRVWTWLTTGPKGWEAAGKIAAWAGIIFTGVIPALIGIPLVCLAIDAWKRSSEPSDGENGGGGQGVRIPGWDKGSSDFDLPSEGEGQIV